MKHVLILTVTVCFSAMLYGQKKEYNLSTPEKMIESLNLIGEGTPDYNAISVFYCAEEAKTITAFDNAIVEGRNVFKLFCSNLTTKFSKNVVSNNQKEIEIKPIDSLQKTISFSFKSTGIIEQVVKFKTGSAKYISETKTENGIEVNVKVNGKEKKFIVKLEDNSYKISLPATEIEKMNKAIKLIQTTVEKLNNFNLKIDKGEINNLNFSEVITLWYQDFVN